MIRYLSTLYPDITFIGYDINRELIDMARKTPPFNANLIYFCGIWEGLSDLEEYVLDNFIEEEICINFSSVLHEVYSRTGGLEEIKELIGKLEPRYITIRDMYSDDPVPFSHPHNEYTLANIIQNNAKLYLYSLEFVKKFGTAKDWRDVMHLLMKLQWVDNGWNEEMQENYFSWSIDQFMKDTGNLYTPCFECRYQLPYLSEKWEKEYGWYNPDIHTHGQFILGRNN
jgi:hypothetical protein